VNAHRKLARTAARRGWRTQGRWSTPTQTIRAKGLIYLLTRGNPEYAIVGQAEPETEKARLRGPRQVITSFKIR